MMKLIYIPLAICLTFSVPNKALAADPPATPERYYPDVFKPEGRMTLTPGFAPDGSTIFFAQTDCVPIWECPQRLKFSKWKDGVWTTPRKFDLPIDARVDYPSVTPDGRYLLFSWQAPRTDLPGFDVEGNFDLWRVQLDVENAQPEPIAGPDLARPRAGDVRTLRFVNNETAPNLTKQGDLYFWSERLDAIGERDVFVARSDGKGGFQAPTPLPPPVNSKSRDDGAWVSADGLTMLLTYSNRGGCGGSDLFITSLEDNGNWAEPINLGCDINSSSDEFAGVITPDGKSLVFVSNRPDGVLKTPTFQFWNVSTDSLPRL